MLFDYIFWILQFVYFILAIFLAFYLPGRFFLKDITINKFQVTVLATLIGMVLWAWQGFIFGYIHARWLSYVYLLFFLIFFIKQLKIKKIKFSFSHVDKISAFILTLGVFIQLTSTWFVGTKLSSGLYFCCGNTGDNTLYASIINELTKRFPPFEPGMHGVLMQNYHYWGNLVVAELIRAFHLSVLPTSFQFFMLFLSLALGLSAIVFSQLLNLPKIFYRWFVFFLYFGGDTIFFLLLSLGSASIFSMSSLEDGAKFLSNPSRAFAIVVFFTGLSLFVLWLRKKQWKLAILMSLIFGSLIGFKVYLGIFALSGLGILGITYLYKKEYKSLIFIALSFLLSFMIYLPVNKNAGGLFYIGLWRFENFISQPALGLIHLDMARQIFADHNNWIKLTMYEILFIIIYITSIFGTKLLGIFQTKKSLSLIPKELHILLITGIVTSFILGSFFEQTSGGSNTFNFLVSIFIIGSFYSALACMYWGQRFPKKITYILAIIIICLTIPRVLYEEWINISNLYKKEGYHIFKEEMEGLTFLKEKTPPDSLIVIDNRGFLQDKDAPYIGLIADRSVFLSGIGNELKSHGIDYSDKEKTEALIFSNSDPTVIAAILRQNKINYILLRNTDSLTSTRSAQILETVFKNDFLKIEKVSSDTNKNYLQL